MISESQMKSAKRARNSEFVSYKEVYDPFYEDIVKERIYTVLPEGPHAPNKQEAKALRRICSQTGLTPEQVREHKVYRQELAKASKSNMPKKDGLTSLEKEIRRRALKERKSVARETGMSHHNPNFFKVFSERWEKIQWRHFDASAEEAFSLVS